MNDQNIRTENYAKQYGALLGIISVAFGLMLFSVDLHDQNEISVFIVSLTIIIGMIGLAQFNFRKDNGGYLSLNQATKIGLGMSAILGVVNVLYFLFLTHVLDPEMMNRVLELKMNEFLDQNPEASIETIEQVRSIQEIFSGPLISSSLFITGSLFIGFIASLITGLILKRNRPE